MNAKVIAVWGANGSGKTTTAVNLAFSLSQRNFTVGLISSKFMYILTSKLINFILFFTIWGMLFNI